MKTRKFLTEKDNNKKYPDEFLTKFRRKCKSGKSSLIRQKFPMKYVSLVNLNGFRMKYIYHEIPEETPKEKKNYMLHN